MGTIVVVEGGAPFDLGAHLCEPGHTLVEFAAAWCQTCRFVEPHLDAAVERRPALRLVRVDVRSWTSEVVRQHGVRSLPDLRLYRGRILVTRDAEAIWRFLGVRFEE